MSHAPKICATCRRVLDYTVSNDNEPGRYVHMGAALANREDHVPIPIDPADEIALVCDFCEAHLKADQWVVVSEPFMLTMGTQSLNMSSLWAACSKCGPLILQGDWDTLLEYVVAAHEKAYPALNAAEKAGRRFMLETTYQLLKEHLVTVRRPQRDELLGERDFVRGPWDDWG